MDWAYFSQANYLERNAGMIQRRLAWPLRKDDTHKSRSGNGKHTFRNAAPDDAARRQAGDVTERAERNPKTAKRPNGQTAKRQNGKTAKRETGNGKRETGNGSSSTSSSSSSSTTNTTTTTTTNGKPKRTGQPLSSELLLHH